MPRPIGRPILREEGEMNRQTILEPKDCRNLLGLIRRRLWRALAQMEAAAVLAPLASAELPNGPGWGDLTSEEKGRLIGDFFGKTILEGFNSTREREDTERRPWVFLKGYYLDRLKVDSVKGRLHISGDGPYQKIRDEAFEMLSMIWRRQLRDLRDVQLLKTPTDPPSAHPEVLKEVPGVQAQYAGLPATLQFQALIEDKTAGFVGREYVFEAITSFLSSQPNGYFIIEGDPGVGKSAILAEYARRSGCVAHFNVRSQGINRAGQFLESVCAQLINRYGLPYSVLPPNATRDGAFLGHLLDEVSVRLGPGEQLAITVDALDEVEVSSQQSGSNILYLPASLPRGIYFLLTRRPVSLPLTTHAPLQVLDLMEYKDNNRLDALTFIRQAAARPRVRAWIDAQGLGIEDFISTLGDNSENNFMYLRYVLADIEGGLYEDFRIGHLPRGLEGYYEDHWRRMGMATRPLPRTKIKLVYIMAEVREPISRELISEIAGEDALTVQEVLDEWKQFLHQQQVEGQFLNSLYHASFRDFLHRQDIVQAAGVTIGDINLQIADNLWDELYRDE